MAMAGCLLSVTACHVPVDPIGAPSGPLRSRGVFRAVNPSIAADGQRGEDEIGSPVLPVLAIDINGAAITAERETPGVLQVIEDHDGSLTDLASREASLESPVALELHGDSSAALAKKSYQLELVDEQRKDRDLPLLGLPEGSDWVLHGCGYDPNCVRNALVYTLGRKLGHYAPRTRFVELVVDGAYQGLYVLIERVRRGDARVDVPKPAPTAANGDITGGYIFKMDLGEGTPNDRIPRDWVSPVSQTVYSYYYPRFDQITTAQGAYLRDHMRRFEALMRSNGWNDADTGYRRWLHLPSWVDFALIQELSLNPDAYFKSVYLQKWPQSKGGKLAIGPFWDFDIAFGVVDFRDGRNTQSWAHTMNRFGAERVAYATPGKVPYVPEYWERLWTDPAFQRDLKCRWQELRKGPLQIANLDAMIDSWMDQLAVALPRDHARWPALPKNSYHGGDQTLKTFLRTRLTWMDANLPGQCA
jgi:hypothetical protein